MFTENKEKEKEKEKETERVIDRENAPIQSDQPETPPMRPDEGP